MKAIFRLILLAAIAGSVFVMVQAGNSAAYLGGAAVIFVLILLFRKTVKPRARNRSYSNSNTGSYSGSGAGNSRSLPAYLEIMQIINDYVGYYATDFDCTITPGHIYITIIFAPDTSLALANQRAADLCNEISSTYGMSVSVN